MANRFVRASKYRHVFGRSTKKEQCYDNLRISKNAWDTNLIKANPLYLSVNWESSGGGAFAVIPLDERGRLPEQIPLFRGHTAAVLDTDWSPFNDSLVASSSDDGKVFLWKVPENFTLYTEEDAEVADVTPYSKLSGHSRKVGHVLFNPAAENILASASGDYLIKLWDVEAGSANLNLKHPDIVQSLTWNATGSLLVTTCRDKKLRVWDVRQEKPAHEVPGHAGAKNSRAVWMGEHDRIATTGFSRMSDRQLGLWDIRDPKEPVGGFQILDSISGVCMPFWDEGTQCLYLAGKGDGNIRYYEYENDKFEYLSEYKSTDPQRGIAFLPKRGVNVHENEVARCFKTVNDGFIEPIAFIVPRRAEVFQGDIYPPTVGLTPAMSAAEWLGGKEALPPKISLESIYEGTEPSDIPQDFKPAPKAAPVASPVVTKTEAPKPAPVQSPVQRGPPPSVSDNKASISNMASKFADKDEEPEEDDASSFEEVPKPVERPAASRIPAPLVSEPPKQSNISAAKSPVTPAVAPAPTPSVSHAPQSSISGTTSGPAEGLRGALVELKNIIAAQSKQLSDQTEQISQLAHEVSLLKARVGEQRSSSEKDERIRQLELELEEARS